MASLSTVIFFFLSVITTSCVALCPFEILDNTVTSEDINTILTGHNQIRSLISNGEVPGQPKGVDLETLEWDSAIAQAAQDTANNCDFMHHDVSKDERFGMLGQNYYEEYAEYYLPIGANWNHAIDEWFSEHNDYKYPEDYSREAGHYLQIVSANTKYIGCGYIHYLNTNEKTYYKFYVCNYGPGINQYGPPYKIE